MKCGAGFRMGREIIGLAKRTCFSMACSGGGPFMMRVSNMGMMMRKAGFGMRTFPRSSGVCIDLRGNSISLRATGRRRVLHPNRITACGGHGRSVGMRGKSIGLTIS